MKWKRSKKGKPTGFSVPVIGGGLSWGGGVKEKDVVRDLIVQLEGQRALHGLAESEREAQVNESILWIRDRLSEALVKLADGSEASGLVAHLRERCNDYLTAVPDPLGPGHPLGPAAMEALKQLREAFRVTLAYLGREGGVDRAGSLAARIPEGGIGFAGPSRTIYVEPPFPVRLTCRGDTDFHPEGGYYEVLVFEVFNNSVPPQTVTVKGFGLEFELHAYDTWYQHEQARSLAEAA